MHHAFQIIFHRKIFMGIISSACQLNPVFILTVVTQRMSTIYLNQGVQSLSAVTWFKQTLYHRTQNGLRLFATSTQENPAGVLVSKYILIENTFNVLSPKMRTRTLLFCLFFATLFYQFETISSLPFFTFFLRTPRHLPTSSGQLSCLHNSADGFAPVTDD